MVVICLRNAFVCLVVCSVGDIDIISLTDYCSVRLATIAPEEIITSDFRLMAILPRLPVSDIEDACLSVLAPTCSYTSIYKSIACHGHDSEKRTNYSSREA